jgi:hypothetical protein
MLFIKFNIVDECRKITEGKRSHVPAENLVLAAAEHIAQHQRYADRETKRRAKLLRRAHRRGNLVMFPRERRIVT